MKANKIQKNSTVKNSTAKNVAQKSTPKIQQSLLNPDMLHILSISENGETSGYSAEPIGGDEYCRKHTIGLKGMISTENNSDFPFNWGIKWSDNKLSWRHLEYQVTPQLPSRIIRSYFTTWTNKPCSLKIANDTDFVKINGVKIGEAQTEIIAISKKGFLGDDSKPMKTKLPERLAVISKEGVILDGIVHSKNPWKDGRLLLHGLKEATLVS